MTDYPYDPDLPYLLANPLTGEMMGRAVSKGGAVALSNRLVIDVIDTTPAPRVPEDARFITWWSKLHLQQYMARRMASDRWHIPEVYDGSFKNLPGVTPDTVFTVLEERGSDD